MVKILKATKSGTRKGMTFSRKILPQEVEKCQEVCSDFTKKRYV